MPDLVGERLIDWAGAQVWLATDAPAETVREACARVGGHATLFRGAPAGRGGLRAACRRRCWPFTSGSRRPSTRRGCSIPGGCIKASRVRTEVQGHLAETAAGATAEAVLRACVHCGMCNATCPTYTLTGDELDGPRGRIYLMKQALEGEPVSRLTQVHLDRCLSCRACETTCPSGVEYHRLYDVAKAEVGERVQRPWRERALRSAIRFLGMRPWLMRPAFMLQSILRPRYRKSPGPGRIVQYRFRRMTMLKGCVQAAAAPGFNAATERVLGSVGISAAPHGGNRLLRRPRLSHRSRGRGPRHRPAQHRRLDRRPRRGDRRDRRQRQWLRRLHQGLPGRSCGRSGLSRRRPAHCGGGARSSADPGRVTADRATTPQIPARRRP